MKIRNKVKFIRSIAILVFLLISLFNISIAKENQIETEIISYSVCKGDTLWSIAEEYKADKEDIRKYIHELKELNNLNDCNIIAGQTIKIKKAM